MGRAGMQGLTGLAGMVFDAGFAGFCAVFRRGERAFDNRDV